MTARPLPAQSVEAAILAELDGAPGPSLHVKEAVGKRIGCSLKTVERHAVKMRERGELAIDKAGWPPTSTWELTLGTTSETPNVPNAQSRPQSGVSSAERPVRDTQGVTVPNEGVVPNGHLDEAEERRLREEYPGLW
jgi:hypothetical protein